MLSDDDNDNANDDNDNDNGDNDDNNDDNRCHPNFFIFLSRSEPRREELLPPCGDVTSSSRKRVDRGSKLSNRMMMRMMRMRMMRMMMRRMWMRLVMTITIFFYKQIKLRKNGQNS